MLAVAMHALFRTPHLSLTRAPHLALPAIPDTDNVLCRKTCDSCTREWGESLRLRPQDPGNAAFAAASSFRLSPPARRAYPAGSHVLAAATRHYLLAPLGNLVDERYTAYFRMMPSGTTKDLLRAREGGEERGAAGDQGEVEGEQ